MNIVQFKQDFALAYREALSVLFEMPFILEDMTEDYVRKATSEANLLNSIIFGKGIITPKQEESPKVKKEVPKEEPEEEKVGIGGLFG